MIQGLSVPFHGSESGGLDTGSSSRGLGNGEKINIQAKHPESYIFKKLEKDKNGLSQHDLILAQMSPEEWSLFLDL